MPHNRIIPVFIPHAGCPHHCVFCDQHTISGAVRPPRPEEVAEAVTRGLEKTDAPAEVAFYGGSFTCLPLELQRAYLQAVAPMRRSGRVSALRLSTRPDAITDEILDLLGAYGVKTVELGCQSLDDDVLIRSGRGHTAARIEQAVRAVKTAGFSVIMQLMFGLPGDTPETAARSCRRAAALAPDGVRFYPTVVLPGTALFDMMQSGDYRPMTVDEAVTLCAGLLPIFTDLNIPVIRLGLNPTDELSGGAVAAGAYHPALGELTWARFFLDRARETLNTLDAHGGTVTLTVHPSRLSVMAGQHRQNTEALKKEFALGRVRIIGDAGTGLYDVRVRIDGSEPPEKPQNTPI